MLILSRHIGTTIHIADNITVTVLSIGQNQVRLGIQAPRDIPVFREEVYMQIQLERMRKVIQEESDITEPEIVA